ncbi:rna polymerase ii general transcription and dna repair factor tfiih component [Stylonychia lemnae]|uniref:General transcription and DNA repair factor IIH subunit TFB5 n=1 Tax=Stylonychia lemnae TaxID=5949 RepID=A0A078ALV2_STYLE|nr:rna polymerase ii general transcription and dna repair factor tfiih component [Stylonychia lemnae]|eukprot:CDW81833.1 rna polymerase ii general transcription and dna repair factor tfiih component [Stylonychia lemnae]
MPKTKKGILIETDKATKIYLLTFKDKENFIIKDLDDNSLFIEEAKLDWVKEKVLEFKNKYSYEKPQVGNQK